MSSIHFIPFHGCILTHWVLFTPFSTNPGPYEPVMWDFNPYFLGAPQNTSEQFEYHLQLHSFELNYCFHLILHLSF